MLFIKRNRYLFKSGSFGHIPTLCIHIRFHFHVYVVRKILLANGYHTWSVSQNVDRKWSQMSWHRRISNEESRQNDTQSNVGISIAWERGRVEYDWGRNEYDFWLKWSKSFFDSIRNRRWIKLAANFFCRVEGWSGNQSNISFLGFPVLHMFMSKWPVARPIQTNIRPEVL